MSSFFYVLPVTARDVMRELEMLGTISSTSERVKRLGWSLDSPLFLRVCKAAYDPTITYGVRKIPERDPALAPGSNTLDEQMWWDMLDQLSARKLTGSSAAAAIAKAMAFLTAESAELFRRIVTRDLKSGFEASSINKAKPGTIRTTPYMRCSLPKSSNIDKFDWAVGVIAQVKADGMFVNVTRSNSGEIVVTTRRGNEIPLDNLDELRGALEEKVPAGYQLHGEMTVYDKGILMPREAGNGVLNAIANGEAISPSRAVVIDFWDIIPEEAIAPKGKCQTPYIARLNNLMLHVGKERATPSNPVGRIETRVVFSYQEARAYYSEVLMRGGEGVIVKSPRAIWKDGTSKDQVKLKMSFQVDLKIVGFVEGTPGAVTEKTFGAFMLSTEDGQLQCSAGSGITVAMRETIHADRAAYMGKIVTVGANAIMYPSDSNPLHSLFLPVVVEVRTDKDTADSLQQVKDQYVAAVEAVI